MDFKSKTEMSKRTSDRLTPAEGKITKWFTTKARNEPQESKDEEKPVGADVSEMITEIEEPTPVSLFVKTNNQSYSRKS